MVYVYKFPPFLKNAISKNMNKISFYLLNLTQIEKMIRKNIFSISVSLIILYLSLSTPQTFVKLGFFDIPYLDKFVHFGLYFVLMGVIIVEHRTSCTNTRKLLLIALIPFFLGIAVEIMQSGLTSYRKGDILDMIADSAGITAALFLWLFIRPYYCKENLR
jgi:hypothetical protein